MFCVLTLSGFTAILLPYILSAGKAISLPFDLMVKMPAGDGFTPLVINVRQKDVQASQSQPELVTSAVDDDVVSFEEESVRVMSDVLNSSGNYLFQGTCDLDRPGNALFQFASGLCLARINNLTHVLSLKQSFSTFLKAPPFMSRSADDLRSRRRTAIVHTERFCCSFDDHLVRLEAGQDHVIQGYLQSWKYFEPCKQEVKAAVTFIDDVRRNASNIIEDLRAQLPGRILVGVHIRMEDFTNKRATNNGKRTAPPGYFLQAMRFFRAKFGRVGFVVITKDPRWWLLHVKDTINVILRTRSAVPVVDMEILSRLDHMIVSVGTFGWWCGYRNNGTVVVYKDFYTPDTHLANQIRFGGDDFIYPTWIRI